MEFSLNPKDPFFLAWSKKWEDSNKKSPEYGSLKTAMYGIMLEGEQLADVHYEVHEKLMTVNETVNRWKKDNYHKTLMNFKEVKIIDEGFSNAQKPWSRRLDEGKNKIFIISLFHTAKIVCTKLLLHNSLFCKAGKRMISFKKTHSSYEKRQPLI